VFFHAEKAAEKLSGLQEASQDHGEGTQFWVQIEDRQGYFEIEPPRDKSKLKEKQPL
jgi:hypothetical protein